MTEQLNDKAKRFFEYLTTLSSLNSKRTQSIQEYEKIWNWDDFSKIQGCNSGANVSNSTNLLEVHKPKMEQNIPDFSIPYPTLEKKIYFDYKKELNAPSFKHILKLDEKLFEHTEENGRDENSEVDQQQLSEWTEWFVRKRQFNRANHLYSELLKWMETLDKESGRFEVVCSKGLLKWVRAKEESEIELPLFTTKLQLSIHEETGLITLHAISNKLRFERDLLNEINVSDINQFNLLIEKIENSSFLDDLSEEFKQLANLFEPNGRFIETRGRLFNYDVPIIIDQSLLIIRSIHAKVLRDDLQQIKTAIDHHTIKLPNHFYALLGDESKNKSSNNDSSDRSKTTFLQSLLPNLAYFPIESNENQKTIVQQIHQHNGVNLQIPPDTNKTTTIANLVSHLLAEGNRVLITVNDESSIAELKKAIPKELQNLCISISGDANLIDDAEQSLRAIGEKLETDTVQKLRKSIDQNQELLRQSLQDELMIKEKLKQKAISEGTPILYQKEQLFKYDVAKRLAEATIDYQWIADELPLIMKFPLTPVEWEDFCTLQNTFDKSDLALLNVILPSTKNDILSESAFKTLIEEEKKLVHKMNDEFVLPIQDKSFQKSNLLIMKDLVEEIIENHQLIKDESYGKLIENLLTEENQCDQWRKFIAECQQTNHQALSFYADLVGHSITLPNKSIDELALDLMIAKERIQSSKKPNALFYLGKGKFTKYLFQTVVLNGRSIENHEDILILEKYLKYNRLIIKLANIINRSMEAVNLPEINRLEQHFPELLEEKLKQLSQIIDIVTQHNELSKKLQTLQLQTGNIFDITFFENLENQVEHTLNAIKMEKWQEEYELEKQKLANLALKENVHSIVNSFLKAMEDKDYSTWKILIKELKELQKFNRKLAKWKEYANILAEKLPLTVEQFKNNFGKVKINKDDYLEAFVLKKMETWLYEDGDINSGELVEQLHLEREKQRNLIRKIVADASWVYQIDRMTDQQKSALSAWKYYMKKIGKGKEKFATDVRESMKKVVSSIPVWIMPVHQVIQQFPITDEKFDVIILDESNQYDLFSINVLLRGKKVIVLGDNEPITPIRVRENQESIKQLLQSTLSDVPNHSLYNGEKSIFEISKKNFPTEVLRNISEISNDELISLHHSFENEKLASLCQSSFERDVLKIILSKGYQVNLVKTKLYKINFIIEGQHNRLVAICEGADWLGIEHYEEELKQQESLEQMGWKLWFISGKEFYANPDKTIEELISILNELNIFPTESEKSSSVVELSNQTKVEQIPKIHFQITSPKKISENPLNTHQLSEESIGKTRVFEENQRNSKWIFTNKNQNKSKRFSVSTVNEIPPELIQNVLIQGKMPIVNFLNDLGFETIDYRLKDGSLWVMANEEIKPFMEKLEEHDISFRYISQGGNSTNGHPAWFTKLVDQE